MRGPVSTLLYCCPCLPTKSLTVKSSHGWDEIYNEEILTLLQVNMTTAYLHSIMAEEEAGFSGGGHLKTGGATPYRRLSDEKLERAALVALVTLTEHVYEERYEKIHNACNLRFLNAAFNNLAK